MSKVSAGKTRINLRLPKHLKKTIEKAASVLGQSITEFVVATTVREARHVLRDAQVTELSDCDQEAFFAALEVKDCEPNNSLKAAARLYLAKRVRSQKSWEEGQDV